MLYTRFERAVTAAKKNCRILLWLSVLLSGFTANGQVTRTVGASGADYATLKAAFDAINTGALTAPGSQIILDVINSTTETASAVLNGSGSGAASYGSVVIKPAAGVTAAITGSVTSGLVIFNGADFVTMDGSNNGSTSRDLTIQNTNTASGSATIWVRSVSSGDAANNVTVRNCVILGNSASTTSAGLISSGSAVIGGPAEADNVRLTFANNLVRRVLRGIQVTGPGAPLQTSVSITNNEIGDSVSNANSVGEAGILVFSAAAPVITGNHIFNVNGAATFRAGAQLSATPNANFSNNIINKVTTTQGAVYGLNILDSCDNMLVANNLIKNISASTFLAQNTWGIRMGDPGRARKATGITFNANIISSVSTSTFGFGGKGIDINTGLAASNLVFTNNMISDIRGTSTGSPTDSGIIVGFRISGATGGVRLDHNSIALNSGNFAFTNGTFTAAVCISGAAVSDVTLRNNILYTNLQNANAPTAKSYALYSAAPAGAFTAIDGNNYAVGGTQGVLGFIGGVNRTTLSAVQTGFGGNAVSVSVVPSFLSVTDLHLPPCSGQPGIAIPSVTTDIDGDIRAIPVIGADEPSLSPAQPGPVAGNAFPCAGATGQTYSIGAVTGAASYTWTVPAGWSITAGQGTTQITVTAGSAGQAGNISVTAGNNCGSSSAQTLAVGTGAPAATPVFASGSSTLCSGTIATYTATAANSTSVTYSVTGGAQINPNTGAVSNVTGDFTITATATGSCGPNASQTFQVTVTPGAGTPAFTAGATALCAGSTSVYTATAANSIGLIYSVSGGADIDSTTGAVSNVTGNFTVKASATGSCGPNTSQTLSVVVNPGTGTPVFTQGATALCAGSTSEYAATAANSTSVTYSVTGGAQIDPNTGAVSNVTGDFTITATATGACGPDASQTLSVTVGAPQTWYADADNDNYGAPGSDSLACDPPAGYVANNTDCNDGDPGINPAALEILNNGIDENCSGADSVTVSVGDEVGELYGVYPNPGSEALYLYIPDNELIAGKIVIQTADGRIVWRTENTGSMRHFKIATDGWAAGFYLINLVTEKKFISLRWLKT